MSRTPSIDLESLAERVAALVDRLAAAQVSVPEDSTVLTTEHPTVLDALHLVGQTAEILDEIGSEESEDDRFTDLASLARLELGAERSELRDVAGRKKTWQALGQAASAMSKAERALVALEREIHAALGRKTPSRPGELEESLEIRAQYAILRDWLASCGSEPRALLDRFGEAAERLRRLRQLDVYPLMRIEDRRQVRSLLERIDATVERDRADEDAAALWQDLQAAAELFLQINHRHELVQHDSSALGGAPGSSGASAPGSARTAEEIAGELRSLLGRDRRLDEVLLQPERFSNREARKRVGALRDRFRGRFG